MTMKYFKLLTVNFNNLVIQLHFNSLWIYFLSVKRRQKSGENDVPDYHSDVMKEECMKRLRKGGKDKGKKGRILRLNLITHLISTMRRRKNC